MTRDDDLIEHRRELENHGLLGLKRLVTRNGKIVGRLGLSEPAISPRGIQFLVLFKATPTRRTGTSTSEVHLHKENL